LFLHIKQDSIIRQSVHQIIHHQRCPCLFLIVACIMSNLIQRCLESERSEALLVNASSAKCADPASDCSAADGKWEHLEPRSLILET